MRSRAGWTMAVILLALASVGAGWFLRARLGGAAPTATRVPEGEAASPHDAHSGAAGEPAREPSEEGAAEATMPKEEPRTAIEVSAEQQARIGLKVHTLTRLPVQHTIRAVGIVTADERLESHVHTRIPGYVETIEVDAVGDQVHKGQVLYRLYSPELVSTQQEYVTAAGRGELSERIAAAALGRLALWDVPSSEISRLRKTKEVRRTLAFRSPVDGFVIRKQVLRGMYVMPEMELYHLADLSRVWVVVTLYEHELALAQVGDLVLIEVAGIPDRTIAGTIGYIYPEVDVATRTAKARVIVDNHDFLLKPGMYATIGMTKDLGASLVAPEDSIIDTGTRSVAFVQTSATQFVPREVELGARVQGGRIVRAGIDEGESVVVRASFLIDAESRLQAALQRGETAAGPPGHAGHGDPAGPAGPADPAGHAGHPDSGDSGDPGDLGAEPGQPP